MSDLLQLVRPDLKDFRAYGSARREAATGRVWLNANESPWPPVGMEGGLNRYPEPQPARLREGLASLYGVAPEEILLTRGSDEGMDLICRAFCRAGRDGVLVLPPTFGMYEVCARLQGASVRRLELDRQRDFRVDAEEVLNFIGDDVRVVFLCSPNNPTGSVIDPGTVTRICDGLSGRAAVVLDQAYGEFDSDGDVGSSFPRRPENLVVLRTLSKAHALAGARVGALVAEPGTVEWLGRLLPPYPLPSPSVELALKALEPERLATARERIETLNHERERVAEALKALPAVRRVFPSRANFLLVAFDDRARIFEVCRGRGVVVRDVSPQPGLDDCLRLTIGTPEENDELLEVLGAA